MFWKPIVVAKPAGSFKAEPDTSEGELTIKFDRAPSAEWVRIFNEVWSEQGESGLEPSIKEAALSFPAISKDKFDESTSKVLEQCLYETNSRQSDQVAKKMAMAPTKLDAEQASSEYQSAIGSINWG